MIEYTPKLRSWANPETVDPQAIVQAEKTSRLPVVDGVALMPDAHVGKGATVGSVIKTSGAIIPAAVGVDIGCGMSAAPVSIEAEGGRQRLTEDLLPDDLSLTLDLLIEAIPSGLGNWHPSGSSPHGMPTPDYQTAQRINDIKGGAGRVADQLGTLGGGNHFVELSVDDEGEVWLVLHSGSRGVGNQLANLHIRTAKREFKRWAEDVKLEDKDLAYFVQATPEFNEYLRDLDYCQRWAYANRERMLQSAQVALRDGLGLPVTWNPAHVVRCHHNYTEFLDDGSFVTRKGAVRAQVGDLGIIPGSMGTETYLVSGKGNPDSYHSSAHGAGRYMSRSQAKRELSADTLRLQMGGRAWNESAAEALVDEHPGAYKPIAEVMREQRDLVEIRRILTSVLNMKGTK